MAFKEKNQNKIKLCSQDKILYAVLGVIMVLILIAVMYPIIFVISSSFSSGSAVAGGRVLLLPVEFSLRGYELVFKYKQVWTGFKSSVIITLVGTALNILLTTLVAYPLSRREFQGRKVVTALFLIIMFFHGGMIPSYILISKLGLMNTYWSVILSGGISVYNMTIMRTFFKNNIPEELHEAAVIDGIDDVGYLLKIVIPLSKAIFAVITLYYAVAHWNGYFTAMLYIRNQDMQPLQMVLREIIKASKVNLSEVNDSEVIELMNGTTEVMRYAMIVIASLPVIAGYKCVQKFFEKGVMIGSVKG